MFKEINKEKVKITRTASPKKEDAVLKKTKENCSQQQEQNTERKGAHVL